MLENKKFLLCLPSGRPGAMSLIPFLVTLFATAQAHLGIENETDSDLECTNDLKSVFCQFSAQKCSEYNLIVVDEEKAEKGCGFQRCAGQLRCCCSADTMLILGENISASVWKGGGHLLSKTTVFSVIESFKPRTPTIVSINNSFGNFEIQWATNMDDRSDVIDEVAHYKKGDTEIVWKPVPATKVDNLKYYEISGQQLEPSTTYMVRVRRFSSLSSKYSDSSEEFEFTTPASVSSTILVLIIVLSCAAAITSSAIYGCYAKFKKEWDATFLNPAVLKVKHMKEKMLEPEDLIPSIIFPNTPESSHSKSPPPCSWSGIEGNGQMQLCGGVSTGSSLLSYPDTQPSEIMATFLVDAYKDLSPEPQQSTKLFEESNKGGGLFSRLLNPVVGDGDKIPSGPTDLDNNSYSLLIRNHTGQKMPLLQMQTGILYDPTLHPSKGTAVSIPEQQAPACLFPEQDISSALPVDLSYQQHNAEPQSISSAEDTSSFSISSGGITTTSSELDSENPFSGFAASESCPFLVVVNDYQPIESLKQPPDLPLPEETSKNQKKGLEKYQEDWIIKCPQASLNPFPQGFGNAANEGSRQFGPQIPWPIFMSAENSGPIITNNDYHSV